jgi:hypothetical protein
VAGESIVLIHHLILNASVRVPEGVSLTQIDKLRFELDGETWMPEVGTINYSADSHHSSLKAPIVLRKDETPFTRSLKTTMSSSSATANDTMSPDEK